MGASISKMMAKIFGSKEMRLLMLGLDAAGKTSMPFRFINTLTRPCLYKTAY
jgi:ADP-ribosylation factor protein 6